MATHRLTRLVVASALLFGVATPLRVLADANATPAPVVWEAIRVQPAATHVELHAVFQFGRFDGLVSYVALSPSGKKLLPTDGLTFDTPSDHGPYAYTDATEYGCAPGSPCDVLTSGNDSEYYLDYPEGVAQPARIYLVVLGDPQHVELIGSPGWRLLRTTLHATIVRSGQTIGAGGIDERVEHFTEAEGTGGTHGSLAIGTVPCRLAHQEGYVREGYGSAVLTGGVHPAAFDCGGAPAAFDPVAIASAVTHWRLAGSVTGDATGPTRLVIINL